MEWALLLFLFAASAFFSSTETAFFALRHTDLLRWRREGNRRAALIGKLLERPNRLIATIFIGNELVNVSISSVLAALLIARYPEHGRWAAVAAGTLGILVLGDVTPKCLVWPRAQRFSLFAARPIHLFSLAAFPVRYLLEGITSLLLRWFGGAAAEEGRAVLTEREFRALVDAGEESGILDRRERQLIHNIFEMTDRRAGEIMTPLADVFMVPADLPGEELVQRCRVLRRSRVPVYEGDRRNVVGILYLKDLLRRAAQEGGREEGWRGLVRPPFAIATSQKLPLLLRKFQRRKVHLALVVDEYGALAGIVTLEDVLEELFGEIREEHEREEEEIVSRPDGSLRVLGRTPIHRFNEALGSDFPDEEWDTVAGMLLHEFGRLPARGDSIVLSGIRFSVERLKGIRIVEVAVRRLGNRTG